ncbi:MAG TPA: metal-dependent hydrolase [Patescibacteria group bacterium]|nr:metal-dependent hydrolase [Patescibacteria group bacterium]
MLPMSHVVLTSVAVMAAEKMQLLQNVDYRWVLVGSVLPDIIDKPIWSLLYDESWKAARFVGHTPFFSLFILALGYIYWRQTNNNCLIVVSLGCFCHLALDAIWRIPTLLYWPLHGWRFSRITADVQLLSSVNLQLLEWVSGGILLAVVVKFFGYDLFNVEKIKRYLP